MTSAQPTAELMTLTFNDWQASRSAVLEAVPRSSTVGEAIAEAVRALHLPYASFFKALHDGRELNHSDTLDEAGIRSDEALDLVPEVSAG